MRFVDARLLVARDCGTGAGGFKAGNACAKGGDGADGGANKEVLTSAIHAQVAARSQGFTLDRSAGEQPSDGIMVSTHQKFQLILDTKTMSEEEISKQVDEWIEKVWSTVEGRKDRHIGGWTADDGKLYLDVATRYGMDKEQKIGDGEEAFYMQRNRDALIAAHDASQHAVFNLETFKETWLQYKPNDPKMPKDHERLRKEWLDNIADPAERAEADRAGSLVDKRNPIVRNKQNGRFTREENATVQHTTRRPKFKRRIESETDEDNCRQKAGITREVWSQLIFRDCGTGAGGFKAGNACAKGGDGGSSKSSSDITNADVEEFAAAKDGGAKIDDDLGVLVPNNPAEIAALHNEARIALGKRIGAVQSDANFKEENSATTVKQLTADAASVSEQFQNMMDEAARGVGEVNYGENACCMLKSEKSLDVKIAKYMRQSNITEGEAVAAIPDAIRGSIIVQTPEGLGDAARSFGESVRASGGSIKFNNMFDAESPSGYLGVHAIVKLKTKDGGFLNSEVQFHLKAVHDGTMKSIKERSHKLFEKTRTGELSTGKAAAATAAMLLLFAAAAAAASGA